ncbi:MAG: glycoside hydrolase family 125 protein [Firmicutes bacterium]|nr:glycoside hydrolase family 125 protein [Bacillota bacterium]
MAVDLSRHGWEKLLGETCEALRGLKRRVRSVGGREPHVAGDVGGAALGRAALGAEASAESRSARLEERLNLNLLFNYFFAAGRTVDSEELVLVTSRSPLYYVSAAFWARDALLWSFPGLLLLDPGLAEEALGQAFGRYFRHPGIHSLYMDGGLLYPGFELDELAAYPLALWRYVRRTGDRGVLRRRELAPKLRKVLEILAAERHPDPAVELYRTFLLPSDDPATHPYVTYDNALTWRALLATADLLEWAGADTDGAGAGARGEAGAQDAAGARDAAGVPAEAAALRARAAALRESIYRHAVVPGPRGPMFAWSFDLAGGFELGDEPPGSLELLTYYGFCSRDDEVWLNTVAWLHSRDNPYRYVGVPFPGLGCPHAEHPFVMSLFNALLGGLPARVAEAAEVLAGAPLDNGLACESFDRHTGEVKTGAAFATCAGFLGYAMDCVWGAGSSGEDRSGEDREDRNAPTFVE